MYQTGRKGGSGAVRFPQRKRLTGLALVLAICSVFQGCLPTNSKIVSGGKFVLSVTDPSCASMTSGFWRCMPVSPISARPDAKALAAFLVLGDAFRLITTSTPQLWPPSPLDIDLFPHGRSMLPILVPGPGNSRTSSAAPPNYSLSTTHYPLFLHTTARATLLFSSTSFTVPITPGGGDTQDSRLALATRHTPPVRAAAGPLATVLTDTHSRNSLWNQSLTSQLAVYPGGGGVPFPTPLRNESAGEDPALSPFLSPLVPGPGSSRTTRHFRRPPPQPACISNIQWILVRKPDVYSLYG